MDILENQQERSGAVVLDKVSRSIYKYDKGEIQKFIIRKIRPSDNEEIKNLIRSVLSEVGGSGEGSSYDDPELNDMHAAYTQARTAYFVLITDTTLIGTIGIAPLAGMEYFRICELRKLYLHPAYRGMGLGARLLHTGFDEAWQLGYQHCYLETHTKLKQAVRLYEQSGFHRLPAPLGHTGHTAANLWYIKTLSLCIK